MLRNSSPLGCLLSLPALIFRKVIWASLTPEVQEQLKLSTFERYKLVDMKTHSRQKDGETKNTITQRLEAEGSSITTQQ